MWWAYTPGGGVIFGGAYNRGGGLYSEVYGIELCAGARVPELLYKQ